jgi:hypothetical protein
MAAKLAGYDESPQGLAKLVTALEQPVGEPYRLPDPSTHRSSIRLATGGPVDIATPVVKPGCVELPIVARPGTRLVPRPDMVSVDAVIAPCAAACGLAPDDLRRGSRRHLEATARSLALVVWCEVLGQDAVTMAAALRMSESGASRARHPRGRGYRKALPMVSDVVRALGLDA